MLNFDSIFHFGRNPERNDNLNLFLRCYLQVFFAWFVAASLVCFLACSFVFALIISLNRAVVPLELAVQASFRIFLTFLPPIIGLVALLQSIMLIFYNNKAHAPFNSTNGILPVYKRQKKTIELHLTRQQAFEKCLSSLSAFQNRSVNVIEEDVNIGKIKSKVSSKPNSRKGQIIEFEVEACEANLQRISVTSYSDNFLKGLDFAENIKNIVIISDHLNISK